MNRSLALLALLASLAGCATLRPGPTPGSGWQGPSIAVSQTDEALRYYVYLRGLSAAELAREHDAVRQAFNKSRGDFARVQYALTLSLPNTRLRDEARAIKLLEGWQREDEGGLKRFGYFLVTQLAEQKRADETADTLRAKLKDEQKRADDAENKLNALKSIEKSLMKRSRAP